MQHCVIYINCCYLCIYAIIIERVPIILQHIVYSADLCVCVCVFMHCHAWLTPAAINQSPSEVNMHSFGSLCSLIIELNQTYGLGEVTLWYWVLNCILNKDMSVCVCVSHSHPGEAVAAEWCRQPPGGSCFNDVCPLAVRRDSCFPLLSFQRNHTGTRGPDSSPNSAEWMWLFLGEGVSEPAKYHLRRKNFSVTSLNVRSHLITKLSYWNDTII